VEKCIIYSQLRIKRFFLRTTKFLKNAPDQQKKIYWPKQKNTCFMILNDKPNCQVSKFLMSPLPIYLKRSENDSDVIILTLIRA
jgi:hypothetical protein